MVPAADRSPPPTVPFFIVRLRKMSCGTRIHVYSRRLRAAAVNRAYGGNHAVRGYEDHPRPVRVERMADGWSENERPPRGPLVPADRSTPIPGSRLCLLREHYRRRAAAQL